jgi:hypothetical protein
VEIKTPNTGETAVAAKLQRSDLFPATSSIKKTKLRRSGTINEQIFSNKTPIKRTKFPRKEKNRFQRKKYSSKGCIMENIFHHKQSSIGAAQTKSKYETKRNLCVTDGSAILYTL